MCRPLLLCILWSTYSSNFNCNATWTTTYGAGGDLNVDLTMGGATAILVDLISGDMYSGPRLSII